MGKSSLNIFEVSLSRPEGVYFPGQVIYGLLTLEVADALKLTGKVIFLFVFQGECRQW